MVWDLQEGLLLHQSSQLTSAPVTSLSFDPTAPKLAVGAADGLVMFLDLSSLPACRCLQVGGTQRAVSMLLVQSVVMVMYTILLPRNMLLHTECAWSIISTARISSWPANMLQASRTKQHNVRAPHRPDQCCWS